MKEKIRNELISKLEEAVESASQYSGNYSDHFSCAEDFYDALKVATEKLKNDDYSNLGSIIAWFVPSYDWDDFVGDVNLGNDVFKLLITFWDILIAEKKPKSDEENINTLPHSDKEIKEKPKRETKIESINKKDALKVIKDLIRMQEIDAAFKIAEACGIPKEVLAELISHLPKIDKNINFKK